MIKSRKPETVSHGCNGSLIGNRMWLIEWCHCQCPWMAVLLWPFETFLSPIPRET